VASGGMMVISSFMRNCHLMGKLLENEAYRYMDIIP
jgi:hypothetical protein